MDAAKSLELQNQIRNNSTDFHQYARDLKLWETEMKRKDRELNEKANKSEVADPIVKKPRNENIKENKTSSLVKSPGKKTTKKISGYDYTSWEKFDADKACEELDKEDSDEEMSDIEEEDLDRMTDAIYQKELGNKLVKQEKWGEAIEKYNAAIAIYPDFSVFYANRALCFLKMKNFISAEADCTSSIRLTPNYVKSYLRRAAARQGLNQFEEARKDILKVLELEPNNKQAEMDLITLNKKLNITSEKRTPAQESKSSKEITNNDIKTKTATNSKIEEIPSSSSGNDQNNKHSNDLSWVPQYDTSIYSIIQPIHKAPHQRSKKPLKNIIIQSKEQSTNSISTKFLEKKTNDLQIKEISTKLLTKEPIKKKEMTNKEKVTTEEYLRKESEERNRHIQLLESAWNELEKSNPYKIVNESKVVPNENITKVIKNDDLIKGKPNDIPDVPKNCSQFEFHWRSLKLHEEKQILYLKQINGEDLPNIFQDGLESDTFINILNCLTRFTQFKEPIRKYLIGLSHVRRIKTLIMFLTDSEKSILDKLMVHCEENNEFQQLELETLRKDFGL